MSAYEAYSLGETPDIQAQRNLLIVKRAQQHSQLLRDRVPFALYCYAQELGIHPLIDPEDAADARFFVHRRTVTCHPLDGEIFSAQLYQVGRLDDQTLEEPVYFPNVAIRMTYENNMHGLRFPCGVATKIVKQVVRLGDALYSSRRLPNLTSYDPDILTDEQLVGETPLLYPHDDEQSLIPGPALQLFDAEPIRIIDL